MEEKKESHVEGKAPLKKSNSNKLIKYYLGGVAVFAILVILGVASVIFYKKMSEGRVNSGVGEVNKLVKDLMISTLDSMDFNDFDKDSPLDIVELDTLFSDLNKSSENLKYLSSKEEPYAAGDTVHSAIEVKFKAKNNITNSSLSINMDMYSKNTNEEAEKLNSIDLQTQLATMTYGEFKDLMTSGSNLIDGNIDLASESDYEGKDELITDFEIYVFEDEAFVKFTNSQVSGDADLEDFFKENEGKMLKVDLDSTIRLLYNTNKQNLSTVNSSEESQQATLDIMAAITGDVDFTDTETYEELNKNLKESFEDMDSEDEEILQRIGNPIKNEFKNFFKSVNLFTDIKKIDSMGSESSVCYSGTLDTDNLVNGFARLSTNMIDIVGNDESSEMSKEEIEEQKDAIDQQMAAAKLGARSVDFDLITCHMDDDKSLSGFGMNFKTSIPGNAGTFSFRFENLDYDSDVEFEKPEDFEIDYTNEFDDLVKKLEESM